MAVWNETNRKRSWRSSCQKHRRLTKLGRERKRLAVTPEQEAHLLVGKAMLGWGWVSKWPWRSWSPAARDQLQRTQRSARGFALARNHGRKRRGPLNDHGWLCFDSNAGGSE